MDTRIFVEKKIGFRIENDNLMQEFNEKLNLSITSLRIFNVYEVYNIDSKLLEKAKENVFSEIVTDNIFEHIELNNKHFIASEFLPGTFNQRASAAEDCISLIDPSSNAHVNHSNLIIIEGIDEKELLDIKKYYINPIESVEKDLSVMSIDKEVSFQEVPYFNNFINFTEKEVIEFKENNGLAMTNDDLLHIQNYFKNEEKRDPSETEILMLDTYWSDHCRHTTFETYIESVKFGEGTFHKDLENVFARYKELRELVHSNRKPMTLMDMATICGKHLKKTGKLDDMEITDEINACSVYVDVDVNGVDETWLLMFKNETHNHPTEIEPYGGASTCVGGAIRDPLSGRSFVYQAMRVAGNANVLEKIEETLPGKLPQSSISKGAIKGFSSYGNQIGLATTLVKDIYHDGYKAKHMEVGAVVGAVPADCVRRESPVKGDIVIMLGGATGRDGVGGATGSSKEHTEESLETASAEVQKGNAPEERKIQRLFRNKEVTRLIKKSNDFGAGGVSVAIGEIADSLEIHLDNVKTKYDGLTGTEVAISESQERMAVVVEAKDVEKFIKFAEAENIDAYKIADVTDSGRLKMYYKGQLIVDLSREFIDTNGINQKTNVEVESIEDKNIFERDVVGNNLKEKVLNDLASLNITSQKGIIENFDSVVGASTVLMPLGGKHQLTETQASVQKFPVMNGETNTCSIMSFGFNPIVSEWSPFHGAAYAVVESVAKIVAVGGSYENIRFTFQEYFEKLGNQPKKWGKPFAALLGSIYAQDEFGNPAIGGKDSMSGTFKDIEVPPTLISFAVTTEKVNNVKTQEFKSICENIYILKHNKQSNKLPNIKQLKENYDFLYKLSLENKIESAYALGYGGITESLVKMSVGNKIGFNVNTDLDLFEMDFGSIIISSKEELEYKDLIKLGITSEDIIINQTKFEFDDILNSYENTLEDLFPKYVNQDKDDLEFNDYNGKNNYDKISNPSKDVNVLLPVFPGTNSEYDMDNSFTKAGANTKQFVFKNRNEETIKDSIKEFSKLIDETHILVISGGFSAGDEPDGSGKFIANILNNDLIKKSINKLLDRDGLILGICNGFQALVKAGLLPFNRLGNVLETDPTLFKNDINRHISHITTTRVTSNNSPWLSSFNVGETHKVAVSHGEGKFIVDETTAKQLFQNGQVAFQYSTLEGRPTMNGVYNPNGSSYAIEGIVSSCGRILGKMGHSERYSTGVYKNIPGNKEQDIFTNAIKYVRGE